MGKWKNRGIEGLVEEEWSLGERVERSEEPAFIGGEREAEEEKGREELKEKSGEEREGKEKGSGERAEGEKAERGKRKGNWQRYSVLGLVLSMGMGLGYAGKTYEGKLAEGLRGAVSYVGNYIGKEIKKEGGNKKEGGKEYGAKELVMVPPVLVAKEAGGERPGKQERKINNFPLSCK